MRKPLSNEEMQREVARAKRFNDIAFVITVILTIVAVATLLRFF